MKTVNISLPENSETILPYVVRYLFILFDSYPELSNSRLEIQIQDGDLFIVLYSLDFSKSSKLNLKLQSGDLVYKIEYIKDGVIVNTIINLSKNNTLTGICNLFLAHLL